LLGDDKDSRKTTFGPRKKKKKGVQHPKTVRQNKAEKKGQAGERTNNGTSRLKGNWEGRKQGKNRTVGSGLGKKKCRKEKMSGGGSE